MRGDPLEHVEYQWRMARKQVKELAAEMGMDSDEERALKAEMAFTDLFASSVDRERTIERLKDEKRRLLEFLRYYDMGSVELELAARDAIADIDPEE